jgi:phage gp45-like
VTEIDALRRRVAQLERQIERLGRHGRSQFAIGRTTNVPVDTGGVQTVQVQLDALTIGDNLPMMYGTGFGGAPVVGTDVLVAFVEGSRSKGVVVASGNQTSRIKGLSAGDAWLGGHGFSIVINSGGIQVTGTITQTGDVDLTGNEKITGNVTIDGTLTVNGNVVVTGGSISVGGVVVTVP